MTGHSQQEYDDGFVCVLEAVWGEGFLSPGGAGEVEKIVGDADLSNRCILDIGCGTGGVTQFLMKRYRPCKIVGVDVEQSLIKKCRDRAAENSMGEGLVYRHIQPGPLPFAENSFDVVFTKDSLIHIEDKQLVSDEVFRVLKPEGRFLASDWMCAQGALSREMEHYIELEDLGFGMGHQREYAEAMEKSGFSGIRFRDRNEWYRPIAREEVRRLSGELYDQLVSLGSERNWSTTRSGSGRHWWLFWSGESSGRPTGAHRNRRLPDKMVIDYCDWTTVVPVIPGNRIGLRIA